MGIELHIFYFIIQKYRNLFKKSIFCAKTNEPREHCGSREMTQLINILAGVYLINLPFHSTTEMPGGDLCIKHHSTIQQNETRALIWIRTLIINNCNYAWWKAIWNLLLFYIYMYMHSICVNFLGGMEAIESTAVELHIFLYIISSTPRPSIGIWKLRPHLPYQHSTVSVVVVVVACHCCFLIN